MTNELIINKGVDMSNLSMALHQVNRAIDLYFNEHDYLCTITLSGAAETILLKNVIEQEQVRACEDVIFNHNKRVGSVSFSSTKKMEVSRLYRAPASHETEVDLEFKARELLMHCCDNIIKLNLPRSQQVSTFIRSKSKILI